MNSTKQNVRTAIGQHVARAIASTKEDDPQNTHNWIEITTDRIINEFLANIPEPIDIKSKYELSDTGRRGIYVVVKPDQTEEENQDQLAYLARFADDQGYNRYRSELVGSIKGLYKA